MLTNTCKVPRPKTKPWWRSVGVHNGCPQDPDLAHSVEFKFASSFIMECHRNYVCRAVRKGGDVVLSQAVHEPKCIVPKQRQINRTRTFFPILRVLVGSVCHLFLRILPSFECVPDFFAVLLRLINLSRFPLNWMMFQHPYAYTRSFLCE